MNEAQLRQEAKNFSEYWINEGKKGIIEEKQTTKTKGKKEIIGEKQNTQRFWMSFLRNICGVLKPETLIKFESPVTLGNSTGYIDAWIPSTKVLIEQKGSNIDLSSPGTQSDETKLTPFGQAKRYADNLPYDEKPRWIITCNFKEFQIHDMNKPPFNPETILLEDLEENFHKFDFLVDSKAEPFFKEESVVKNALQAGEHVREIYNALAKQYKNPESDEARQSLNALCVRLVFCLYAEDAGIFKKNQFYNYMVNNAGMDCGRTALIKLFKILDTEVDKRDPYEQDDLLKFPYVDGSLFAEDHLEIPKFNDEILLDLKTISGDFNWSSVSPTIFGSVFESTLNPVTRNTEGMHYTSEKNIHKVIDPLFLDDLKKEFEEIKKINVPIDKEFELQNFQKKLASIKILDPACGSGNFLTESYLSLRTLENELLQELEGEKNILVNIHQFYGIEIHDFAVKVAQTAMLIAENQMMQQTRMIVNKKFDFLPLKKYEEIIEGNALKINWADLVKPSELSYIIGNPPFAGKSTMTREQKAETEEIFKGCKNIGNLDYVCNWFKKSSDFIDGTPIRCALLSTNSICQGEQVAILWKPLFEKIHFDFAYRSFKWSNEAKNMAMVHCIILGFSQADNSKPKLIFESTNDEDEKDDEDENKKKKEKKKPIPTIAKNINAYLLDADNIFVEKETKPISNVSKILWGSKPVDDGNLILSPKEKNELLKKYPAIEKFIRPFLGAEEFVKCKERFCLWLVDAEPYELKNPEIKKRIEQVKEFRLKSTKAATREQAMTPHLFTEIREPKNDYLALSEVSTSNRHYIPIGYLDKNVIASNRLYTIPNATLYEFGVITSKVHMAWMRLVAGRFGTAYTYSSGLVYNTFVWCEPTKEQKEKIKQTAQKILDVREKYFASSPKNTYAVLYDGDLSGVPDLRKAHEENDKAVMQAYGFDLNFSEADIVRELLNLYEKYKTK